MVTVGRSDYGIYRPVLTEIRDDPELELRLFVGGMHLLPEFGSTVDAVEGDGFAIAERVEMLLASDTPEAISKSTGLGVVGFAQAYARSRPDVLMVLGDRFEMHAAALAALPFKIPVAHISGGEMTRGAFDDALRHCITKLSHLHFVTTEEYARRVRQLGEESWRVTNCGSPSLDTLLSHTQEGSNDLEARYGFQLDPPPLLVTFHPVTLEYEDTEWHAAELLAALDESGAPTVFTMPNADTNGHVIARKIQEFVGTHPSSWLVENLGIPDYFSVMARSAAMVGNSSSGVVEAAPLSLPVVNIGSRQEGRVRTPNIIDVGYPRAEILEGIRRAVSDEFRETASGVTSPFGDGHAAKRIVDVLKTVELGDRLLMKRFIDQPVAAG